MMKMRNSAVAAIGLWLAACGSDQTASGPNGDASEPAGAETQIALGLTERQLLDADLVDASGNDLGDIEGVVREGGGEVTHLLVEIENTSPDRYVHVPIEGLEPFDNRGDRDVRTSMTRDQLLALPEVTR